MATQGGQDTSQISELTSAKALAVAALKVVDTRQEAAALATALAVHWLPTASANADAAALAVQVPAPEAVADACSRKVFRSDNMLLSMLRAVGVSR